MKLINKIYWFLLLWSIQGTATAQLQRYFGKRYDTDNGLPQNSVSHIGFDRGGFCWLSTQMGLVRFDGNNFKVYGEQDFPQAQTSRVYDVRADREGNLWGVMTSGTRLAMEPKGPFETAIPMVRGTVNNVFPRDGYFTGDVVTQTVKQLITDQKAEEPRMGMLDTANKLWGIGEEEAYLMLEDKLYYIQGRHYERLGPSSPKGSLAILDSAAIKFSNGNRLTAWYKNKPLESVTSIQGALASEPLFLQGKFTICWCPAGTFIYCNGVLYKLSFKQQLVYAEKMVDNLHIKELSSVYYQPSTKILFLGSYIDGLYVLKPVPFKVPAIPESLPDLSQNFYVQAVLDSNRLFCHNILFARDAASSYFDIRGNRWGALFAKNPHFIYFSKDSTLCSYDFLKKERKEIANVKSWVPLFLASLYDSTLYFATTRRIGIIKNNEVKDLRLIEVEKRIVCMVEHSPGSFYIGTQEGLFEYEWQQHKLRKINVLDTINIRTLHWESSNKRLWIGTYGTGAFLFENGQLFPVPQLVPALSAVHSFIDDGRGFFWLTTNKGLFKVNKNELLELAHQKREQAFFYVFDRNDGLPTSEFNGGFQYPYVWFPDSTLSLPTLKGLVWLHPHHTGIIYPDKKIYLDMISIDGSVQKDLNNNISLPVGKHALAITVATPYFGNPANLHLQYMIQNWNEDWKSVPVDGRIVLENLPPGKYSLIIRQEVITNNRDAVRLQLQIQVPPPFFQTIWFRVLVLALMAIVIYLLAGWRIRGLQMRSRLLEEKIQQRTVELNRTVSDLEKSQQDLSKSNHVKDLMISMVLHDLQSPIRFLNTLVKHLNQQYAHLEPGQLSRKMSELKSSTNALFNFTAQFFTWVRSQQKQFTVTWQEVSLGEVFEEIGHLYSDVMKSEGNTLLVIPTNLTCFTDAGLLNGILRNLVDNANKNTNKGEVKLTARQRGDDIEIELSDSGIGMDETEIMAFLDNDPLTYRGGLGRILIKDMLDMIGGKLEIESEKGKGTVFRVVIPNNRQV
ncbi:sensor histidine kinase [Pseudobacter ginsenosidimutans]|uniref:histidine kinase n=2 Tax=Pseudobacter ginsenosidimutans TaxID=661488 RepID=A0A4Q7N047_9BACT|nr:ATP-binding protein [Pseudobacter ginsenosidimutans]RZS74532.1 signal transduction histidine kinase [Pseudobacter ginsenosidimutans]